MTSITQPPPDLILEPNDEALRITMADELFDWVSAPDYPCLGAKSVLARDNLAVIVAHDITSNWDDLRIHGELVRWAKEWRADPSFLRSLAVVFAEPSAIDEPAFEAAMWERLQSFADKDDWCGQAFDTRVSPDPEDPHFSLSFGEEAFFVVGLHPGASRPARRFRYPTLIFNLHEQFERLREEGRYERMREAILARDHKLAGSVNPMLAQHGLSSEARQYSGRIVPDEWECPFSDPRLDEDADTSNLKGSNDED